MSVFGKKKVFFAVVHIESMNEDYYYKKLEEVENLMYAGVDGVFFISHGFLNWEKLLAFGRRIKDTLPSLWVGYNFLDLSSAFVFKSLSSKFFYPDGLWVSNSIPSSITSPHIADMVRSSLLSYKQNGFDGLLFGGIPESLHTLSSFGKKDDLSMDTIFDKIAEDFNVPLSFSSAPSDIGVFASAFQKRNRPLALAGGVSLDNIGSYFIFVDFFFISTEIYVNNEIDLEKVKRFSKVIGASKGWKEF